MPIKFHLPGNIARDAVMVHNMPDRYRKLRLPIEDTQTSCVFGHWGAIISQQIPVEDNTYCELYAEALTDMDLYMSVSRPVVIIQIMLTGTMRLIHPEGQIPLQTNKIGLLYLAPGLSYKLVLAEDRKYRAVYFQVPLSLMKRLSGTYPQLNNIISAYDQDSPARLSAIRLSSAHRIEIEKIQNCDLVGQARGQYIHNRISDVLISYLDSLHRISEQDSRLIMEHEKEIDEFIDRVDQFPEIHVNVEQQAQLLGLSERILECAFKVKIGNTVRIYIAQQRVEKAKKLLIDTTRSITDIALEVGYSDVSYFIKVFKQVEGVTPGKYRSDHNAAK